MTELAKKCSWCDTTLRGVVYKRTGICSNCSFTSTRKCTETYGRYWVALRGESYASLSPDMRTIAATKTECEKKARKFKGASLLELAEIEFVKVGRAVRVELPIEMCRYPDF